MKIPQVAALAKDEPSMGWQFILHFVEQHDLLGLQKQLRRTGPADFVEKVMHVLDVSLLTTLYAIVWLELWRADEA